MSAEKELIGATVTKVIFEDGVLELETDRGTFYTEVYGDCCSQTWIEHVESPSELPFVIGAVEDVGDMSTFKHVSPECEEPCPNKGDDHNYHDYVEHYGYRITTTKGEWLSIDFRNDSNGYYGGSLSWRKYPTESELSRLYQEDNGWWGYVREDGTPMGPWSSQQYAAEMLREEG